MNSFILEQKIKILEDLAEAYRAQIENYKALVKEQKELIAIYEKESEGKEIGEVKSPALPYPGAR